MTDDHHHGLLDENAISPEIEVQEIAHNQMANDHGLLDENGVSPGIEVTCGLIESVCLELSGDPNLSASRRIFFGNIQSEQVVSTLAFMNDCLPPAGRFHSATKEKAWALYHKQFAACRTAVQKATRGSAVHTGFMCLKISE